MKSLYKTKNVFLICLFLFLIGISATGCSKKTTSTETIKILSGSENKVLEPILEECKAKTGVTIEMTYKGSVDIMQELKAGATEYDAVWPASSIWISLGDVNHTVKHSESISMTPVVFGIQTSLAKQYGLTNRKDVSIKELLSLIQQDKLSFCMSSATQSNSGASAYIGFLYALLDKKEAMTEEDLESNRLKTEISNLLHGVERSSGSSDWLKDMFLKGNYETMVNYEALIIDANKELTAQGEEPLYVVYPYDGLSLADCPLGYVDHGNKQKEEAFLLLQDYLLSEKVQKQIEHTGRRISASGVSKENQDIFCAEWGIDTEAILSPITMPSEKVLQKALDLYQTSFRKPSLNIYCLDFSGSMRGEGHEQLLKALQQILIQENAKKHMLQAEEDEVNIILTFNQAVKHIYKADSSDAKELEKLYKCVKKEKVGGHTDIYTAMEEAVSLIDASYDVSDYTPAIILMTDGKSDTDRMEHFMDTYDICGMDLPVFSIMFGEASEEQLDPLAEYTNAKVFDGRKNLIEAFKTVKGYN